LILFGGLPPENDLRTKRKSNKSTISSENEIEKWHSDSQQKQYRFLEAVKYKYLRYFCSYVLRRSKCRGAGVLHHPGALDRNTVLGCMYFYEGLYFVSCYQLRNDKTGTEVMPNGGPGPSFVISLHPVVHVVHLKKVVEGWVKNFENW